MFVSSLLVEVVLANFEAEQLKGPDQSIMKVLIKEVDHDQTDVADVEQPQAEKLQAVSSMRMTVVFVLCRSISQSLGTRFTSNDIAKKSIPSVRSLSNCLAQAPTTKSGNSREVRNQGNETQKAGYQQKEVIIDTCRGRGLEKRES